MVLGRVKKLYKGLEVGGSIDTGGSGGRMVYTSREVNQSMRMVAMTLTSLLSSLTNRIGSPQQANYSGITKGEGIQMEVSPGLAEVERKTGLLLIIDISRRQEESPKGVNVIGLLVGLPW